MRRADKTPGFNHKIPEKIMTPDTVQTRIGTLKFVDGVPTDRDAAEGLRQPRLPARRRGVPQLHSRGLARSDAPGPGERGATKSNQAVIFDQLMDSNPLLLTGNTDTVYCLAFLDLEADGPTVVEIPPGCGPGTVNDAFFRFVIDMGAPGPDRGKGGKYLIVPTSVQGRVAQGEKDGGDTSSPARRRT